MRRERPDRMRKYGASLGPGGGMRVTPGRETHPSRDAAPVPETTSAEGLARYMGGRGLASGTGGAWRDVKAWVVALPPVSATTSLPSVIEPFLAWTLSGEIDFQERENGGPWITHRIRQGSFFLTFAGAPYDVRWKAVSTEPFVAMHVLIGLPLLEEAFKEIYGENAAQARLQDVSAFTDGALGSLMERLRDELERREASSLYVRGIGQAIAAHLARNYAVTAKEPQSGSPSLPGYKLRQVTEWMTAHLAEELDLAGLADRVALSKFYFQRLFKSAVGMSPSRYHIMLRMDEARRLLRETKRSIVEIALEVGYENPSHFAQLFRRETGLSPSDYRRQR